MELTFRCAYDPYTDTKVLVAKRRDGRWLPLYGVGVKIPRELWRDILRTRCRDGVRRFEAAIKTVLASHLDDEHKHGYEVPLGGAFVLLGYQRARLRSLAELPRLRELLIPSLCPVSSSLQSNNALRRAAAASPNGAEKKDQRG